jgi:hypothetical protein
MEVTAELRSDTTNTSYDHFHSFSFAFFIINIVQRQIVDYTNSSGTVVQIGQFHGDTDTFGHPLNQI